MTNHWGGAGDLIRDRLECWLAEPLPRFDALPADRSRKWVFSSALQKTIRRGQIATALSMAGSLLLLEPRYLVRRLPVIALEDVGHGHPDAVEATIWALGNLRWRRRLGTRAVVLKLVEKLSTGLKDRSTTDLVVAAGYDPQRAAERQRVAGATAFDLTEVIETNRDPVSRTIAAWQLAGPGKHRTGELKSGKAVPNFEAVVEATASSPRIAVLMQAAWRKGTDVLPIAFGITAAMVRNSSAWEPDAPLVQRAPIGSLPAEALDQYTREGRRALADLLRAAPAFRRLLQAGGVPERRLGEAAREILFRVEGDAVDRRLTFRGFRRIRDEATAACLRWAGLHDAYHDAALEMLRANMALLDEARRHVEGVGARVNPRPAEVVPESVRALLELHG